MSDVNLLKKILSASGVALGDSVLEEEIFYLKELLRWNKRVNLTSIVNWEDAVEKHLVDSLLLLNHLSADGKLIDLGSGAGLPGIPLAIADRQRKIVSLDSVGKKINFQKHMKRLLQLNNFTAVSTRIEHWDNKGEAFDVVVARAFSSLEDLILLAKPLLKNEGEIFAMKGAEGHKELDSLTAEGGLKNVVVKRVVDYQLPVSKAERTLIVLQMTEF